MRKTVFLFVMAALPFLLSSFAFAQDDYAGLGVHNLKSVKEVKLGKTQPVKVAVLDNTGTIDYSIHTTYTASSTGLNITVFGSYDGDSEVHLNPFYLRPEERLIVYANVTALSFGSYKVQFDFDSALHLPYDIAGNPTAVGGSAWATILAEEAVPVGDGALYALMVSAIILVVLASAIGIALIIKPKVRERMLGSKFAF